MVLWQVNEQWLMRWAFLLLITTGCWWGCTPATRDKTSGDAPPFLWANTTDNSQQIKLKQLGLHYRSVDDMLHAIQQQYEQDTARRPLHYYTYRYVIEHTRHYPPFFENNWYHRPQLMINSTAMGWCDDRAALLAALWQQQGYVVRVWSLGGHVVAEVQDAGGKRQVYDADMGFVLNGTGGDGCSLSKAEAGDFEVLSSYSLYSLQQLYINMKHPQTDTSLYQDYYSSTQDNREVTSRSTGQQLPLSEKLVMPPASAVHYLRGENVDLQWLVVRLLPQARGPVYLPLLPYAATGTFSYSLRDHLYQHTGQGRLMGVEQTATWPDSLHIRSVTDTTYLFFMANGLQTVQGAPEAQSLQDYYYRQGLTPVQAITALETNLLAYRNWFHPLYTRAEADELKSRWKQLQQVPLARLDSARLQHLYFTCYPEYERSDNTYSYHKKRRELSRLWRHPAMVSIQAQYHRHPAALLFIFHALNKKQLEETVRLLRHAGL